MKQRTLLVLTLLVSVAASAAAKVPPAGAPSPERRQLIIEQAYVKLARFIATGGKQFAVKIADVRTVASAELATTEWLELVTMPGGDMIDVTRETRDADGTRSVVYRASWSFGEDYLKREEGLKLSRMRAVDVLSAAAADNPEVGRVVAITSYQVTVELDGRVRSYRAAALWLPPEPGRDAKLLFIDHITQGLEQAAVERRLPSRPRRQATAKTGEVCVPTSSSRTSYQIDKDQTGHAWTGSGYDGWHIAEAEAKFDCTCEEDCSATCQSTFNWTVCGDIGETTDACHKTATDTGVSLVSTDQGHVAAPACGAGLGCVKRSCTFCICTVGVSASVNGVSVSFAASGSPDWSGNLQFQHTCAGCTIDNGGGGGDDEEYNPDEDCSDCDPGGGGGGGGSSGGCCWWRTTCRYNSLGQYECTISSCGQWGC